MIWMLAKIGHHTAFNNEENQNRIIRYLRHLNVTYKEIEYTLGEY